MSKKVTFNMIASDMHPVENDATITYTGVNNEYEISVKHKLGFMDAMRFVRDLAGSCSDIDSGDYTPDGFDFAVKANALIYYAGFAAPSDVSKAYEVVYGTDLFDKVMEIIDRRQFDTLVKAAKDRLEYTKDFIIASQASKINDLINKMDEVIREGNSVMTQLNSDEFRTKIEDMLRIMGEPVSVETTGVEDGNIVSFQGGEDQ